MKRRNTIQRNLVLEAIRTMKSHVSAEEVFEFIRKNHPTSERELSTGIWGFWQMKAKFAEWKSRTARIDLILP